MIDLDELELDFSLRPPAPTYLIEEGQRVRALIAAVRAAIEYRGAEDLHDQSPRSDTLTTRRVQRRASLDSALAQFRVKP